MGINEVMRKYSIFLIPTLLLLLLFTVSISHHETAATGLDDLRNRLECNQETISNEIETLKLMIDSIHESVQLNMAETETEMRKIQRGLDEVRRELASGFSRSVGIDSNNPSGYREAAAASSGVNRAESDLCIVSAIGMGISAFQEEEYAESIEHFQEVLDFDPSNTEALCYHAACTYYLNPGNSGNHPRIEADMQKVRESDPDNLTALSILAKLSMETKDRFLAKKYYQRLIELEPEVVAPYLVLGKIAFQDNDLTQAEDFFSGVLERDAKNYSAYYYIGLISDVSGNTQDALAGLEKCIELNPEFLPAYYKKAMLLMGCGDYQNAVDLLKQYSLSRKNYPVLLALGDCYVELNQLDKAFVEWQAAIDTLTINTDADREKAAIANERLARLERVD